MKSSSGEKLMIVLLALMILSVGGATVFLWGNQGEGEAGGDEIPSMEEGSYNTNYMAQRHSLELDSFLISVPSELPSENWSPGNDYYVIPHSNTRILSIEDLEGLTQDMLRVARNEIYARHGRKFKDQELQDWFMALNWYTPIYEPDEFPENILSELEKQNASFIASFEN